MLTRRSPGSIRLAGLAAVPPGTWARIGFAAMCVGALIGYFAFPTYPTYDSFYALLWGRDLLHLHLPDFSVYRAPTEHPLAIAFGMFCSIFGQGGARLMVFGSIVSFVVAVAGHVQAGTPLFRPRRRGPRRAAAAEPLLRREPGGSGLPGHLLRGAGRVGDRAGGRTSSPGHACLPDARRRRTAAPRRLGAQRRLLAVVLVACREPHAGCGTWHWPRSRRSCGRDWTRS